MLRSLEAWITACESEPDPLLTDCVRLFATPLGPHHSRAVFAFTRDDASLRQSAGLPEFDSPSEVRAWVKWQRHARGATVSALVEPQEHGPIGAITLTDDGYFSYWIGTPHQRKGYGRLALQLLVQLASRRRVGRLHSYVESGNDASRRALAASGFVLVGGGDSGWTGQLEYSMEVAYAI